MGQDPAQQGQSVGDRGGQAAVSPVLSEFKDWLSQYEVAGVASASSLAGEELALKRRGLMLQLIKSDAAQAVKEAIPARLRATLPDEVRSHVEEEVSGYGDFLVTVADIVDPATGEFTRSRTERKVILGGKTYEAYVYGRKLGMTTKFGIPLRGVALDGVMAVAEDPVRVLAREEGVEAAGVDAEIGGEVRHFESLEELELHAEQIKRAELTIGPGRGRAAKDGTAQTALADDEAAASPWTEGAKTVLFIRVDFPDKPGEPVTTAHVQNLIDNEVDNYYRANSYNKTSLAVTVTPVMRMPQNASWYSASDANVAQLMTDARNVARGRGYNTDTFSLDVIAFTHLPSLPWAGRGYLGAKGSWLNGAFNLRVTAHELGHNYGLHHANYWDTTDGSVIGAGSSVEYGDPFDIMGFGFGGEHHFGASGKNRLGWLSDADVHQVTAGGTFRIQNYDSPTSTGKRALKIAKDADSFYWVEFRQAIQNNTHVYNGALIHWGYNEGFKQTNLLDMLPLTGAADAPLAVNQTLVDARNGIKITLVAKGATSPPTLDVAVSFTTVISSLTLSTPTLAGGKSATGTVKLTAPAPQTGAVVTLSDGLAATTLPPSVTIPSGATSITFPITTTTVAAAQNGSVSASYRGVSKTAALSVLPVALSTLTLSRSSTGGGGTVTGTVTLNGPAPAAGALVTISDSIAAATTPAGVTVAPGTTTKTFSITTAPVTALQSGSVTASYGGVAKSAPLSVEPTALSSLTLSKASVAGGASVTGTLTLNGPAPAAGVSVSISDNLPATTVPASVPIPAGATTKTFTITTVFVPASQAGTVSAKLGVTTKTAPLTVRPAALASVTLAPASVAGGNAVTGTVSLDGPAPAAGAVVTLTDNLAAATAPARVTVASGASSATFSITTVPVAAKQTGLVTAGYAGASKTAALTVRFISVQSITLSRNPIPGGSSAVGTLTLDRASPTNVAVALSDNLPATTMPASVTVPAGSLTKTFTISTTVALPVQKGVLTAVANGETRALNLSVVNTQAQLLINPGFESGAVAWIASSTKVFDNSNGSRANTGLWDAWLGGYGVAFGEYFYQQITIPSDAVSAELSFYLWLPTQETTTTLANDTLKVQIQSPTGAVIGTANTYSNLNKTNWYVKQSFNLLPYRGQTVRLAFVSAENGSLVTWFFIDDVKLNLVR